MIPGPVSRSGSFFSFLSIPGAVGSKSVLTGGSLVARCILVVGRDFFLIALARVKLHSAVRERTRAPN